VKASSVDGELDLTNNTGRTVRLFLVDGSPTGLITAEIMNWTGHALIASRSRIGEALKREEASRTGVYFLVGDDPDQPTKAKVYIGEGDVVSDRIKIHASDESKEFWTRACFITSKDTNLTKAHVRYLETRLVQLTRSADRANLANSNEPSKKSLPESDIADMEFFLEQIQLILPVVGFDFLRSRLIPTSAVPALSTSPTPLPTSQLELVLTSPKYGYVANAIEGDGELTVLAGSRAVGSRDFSQNSYGPLRAQLIKDGRLKPVPGEDLLEFSGNVSFASPSAAAAVINDRNTNGRTAWRLKSTGQTLKEWQDAQVM
jgi:hypothetical protein